MNEGQQKFMNFIMDNAKEESKLQAHGLLIESFSKQADGTFDEEYLCNFIPRMLELIKPENVDAVKNVMMNYKGSK